MCGRATGWRGELRLAKLSLAVSDSFLLKRRNRGRRKQDDGSTRGNEEGTEDAEGPTVSFREKKREKESCLSSVPSPVLGSFGPSRKPQISSFSSSCTQPALDLIAYPVFLLIPDFPALLGPSSLLILRLCFSFLFLLSSSLRSPRREKLVASGSEPGERGSRIDLMRIIPALIAKAHGMVQAVLGRLAIRLAGWPTD